MNPGLFKNPAAKQTQLSFYHTENCKIAKANEKYREVVTFAKQMIMVYFQINETLLSTNCGQSPLPLNFSV